MVKGIYQAAAAMMANQRHLEVTSNNISNADTYGYKEERISFSQMLNASPRPGLPVTEGEKYVETERGFYNQFEQGVLMATENPLDLAIAGPGFFAVETANGVAYTRDGRFQLNAEGELVTTNGHRVLTESGTMTIPEGSVRISPEGEIVYEGETRQQDQVVDKLKVVIFDDTSTLRPIGNGLLTSQSEAQDLKEYRLEPGYLESSSVNLTTHMIDLIAINKSYDAASNVIKTIDTILRQAVNEVGKTR